MRVGPRGGASVLTEEGGEGTGVSVLRVRTRREGGRLQAPFLAPASRTARTKRPSCEPQPVGSTEGGQSEERGARSEGDAGRPGCPARGPPTAPPVTPQLPRPHPSGRVRWAQQMWATWPGAPRGSVPMGEGEERRDCPRRPLEPSAASPHGCPPAQAEPQTLLGPSKGMRTSTWPSGGPKGPSLGWPPTCATLPSGKDQVTCHVSLCDRRANPGSEAPHRPLGPPGGEAWGGLGSRHLCPVGRRSWRAGASKPPHHLGTGSRMGPGKGGGLDSAEAVFGGACWGVLKTRGAPSARWRACQEGAARVGTAPRTLAPASGGPHSRDPCAARSPAHDGAPTLSARAVEAATAPRGQAACRGSHWAGPSLLQPRRRPCPSGPAPPPGRGRGASGGHLPGPPAQLPGAACPLSTPPVLWTPVRHLARPPQLQPLQGCRARAAQRGPWGRSLSPAGPAPSLPPTPTPTPTPSSGWGEGGPCPAAP